ncbi:fatty acid desaturase [Tumidithrix helvetica PCC 7403]|uniref:fatty acid desaturase n=1 Tax=Tumidithrix helvetica TaxID=3457545 RepID=UPI003CA4AB94
MTNQILSVEELKSLNVRSNRQGLLRLTLHLGVMTIAGYLWATNLTGDRWYIAIPSLAIYGFSLAIMFAPLHESSHRTAFANNHLSDAIAWLAGLLSFYNSGFYRQYHKWHHRYAQIPDKDPELSDPPPANLGEYLLQISGIPWWIGKVQTHGRVALGKLEDYPFIPEAQREEVIRSTRLQLLVYIAAIAISIAFKQPWFLLYWLLPLAVGQPFLRFLLMAEHMGCTKDDNSLTNTRTTLTFLPLRYFIWNIPFHAEHHLYPSIPFYMLPVAHEKLRSHFVHVDSGYVNVNLEIVKHLNAQEPVAV